ncbi:hydroxymethylglutaryl-CoA lyase [Marinimicrococcus flavescens]|uniref:Hydroxymethylglutaryl-CoA lyase n=1 Tax=Marinimicrococcus flavescens TaxID=3031815 RepID=A0AAP3UYF1_9PROT|nr:hydroxymethylglutaryl-CoA lyase [Marinimicrococcus flavescens]
MAAPAPARRDAAAASLPGMVTVVEVGPRDGFQMERGLIPTATKIALIEGMIEAGLRHFEATSFVSPRAVPQLADAAEVIAALRGRPGVQLTALVPNAKGAARAAEAGVDAMVVFLSASDTHNRKNVNRPTEESLAGLAGICRIAGDAGIPVQGAIATSFGCPFEGEVPHGRVVAIARQMADLGIRTLSLGDTTGMATPPLVRGLCRALGEAVPEMAPTLHFHNTRGIGLANVLAGLETGVTRYESSIGGLGGCPFAAGATGNICTEDLVYLLDECGIESGVDLEKLIEVAHRVEAAIGRELPGQVMKAGPRLRRHATGEVATANG